MHWVLALGAGAGHGQTRGKCGYIERKGGDDMTRGDVLAEAKAVGSRVGGRRPAGGRQAAGRRPAGVRQQASYRYRNTR